MYLSNRQKFLVAKWCKLIFFFSQFPDVKPRVASSLYDKLDTLAMTELKKSKLGGENAVVLSEIYPDCLNRLSPDTTDQPHVHRILMVADTKVSSQALIRNRRIWASKRHKSFLYKQTVTPSVKIL